MTRSLIDSLAPTNMQNDIGRTESLTAMQGPHEQIDEDMKSGSASRYQLRKTVANPESLPSAYWKFPIVAAHCTAGTPVLLVSLFIDDVLYPHTDGAIVFLLVFELLHRASFPSCCRAQQDSARIRESWMR